MGATSHIVPPTRRVVSTSLFCYILPHSLRFTPALSRSLFTLSLHFNVGLLFACPFLSISPSSLSQCVMPTIACSQLPSFSCASPLQYILLILSSSFCHLVSFFMFSRPSCSLLPVDSPHVSSHSVPRNTLHSPHSSMLPLLLAPSYAPNVTSSILTHCSSYVYTIVNLLHLSINYLVVHILFPDPRHVGLL